MVFGRCAKILLAVVTAAALSACASSKRPLPSQPLLPSDHGRFHIRSVSIVSNESEADFDSAFRQALNETANADAPSGEPVDLIVTIKDFNDSSIAAEMLAGAGSHADVKVELRDPSRRSRTVYASDLRVAVRANTVVGLGNPITALASLAFSAVANAATNESEALGEDLAEIVAEDLLEDGEVILAKGAAFSLPPRRGDPARERAREQRETFKEWNDAVYRRGGEDEVEADAEEDSSVALNEGPDDTPVEPAAMADHDPSPRSAASSAVDAPSAGLFLGRFDDRAAAAAERDDILLMDADLVGPDALIIFDGPDGYTLKADTLSPDTSRALCARRQAEARACGAGAL